MNKEERRENDRTGVKLHTERERKDKIKKREAERGREREREIKNTPPIRFPQGRFFLRASTGGRPGASRGSYPSCDSSRDQSFSR